jgi:hypothetical protein
MTQVERDDARSIVQSLVGGVPRLEDWWKAYQGSDQHAGDLPYVTMGELAGVLIHGLQLPADSDLDDFWTNVDRCMISASSHQRKLLVVGLLEGIQNLALSQGIRLENLTASVGDETMPYWLALIHLWSGVITPRDFNEIVP